jgi:hypothetical protein
MNMLWFLRMSQWVRRPASAWRVKLVLGIVAACLILYGIERFAGFPNLIDPKNLPGGRLAVP